MKTKPLLIIILCVAVIGATIFFFVNKRGHQPGNTNAVVQFVAKFSLALNDGNTDSLRKYFSETHNLKINELINVLANKTSLGTKEAPGFKCTFDYGNLKVISGNGDVAVVQVPVIFSHDAYNSQTSYITLTVRKMGGRLYKFVKVKADGFARDYMVYKAKIDGQFGQQKPVEYSAITLAAFKTAETLKGKYDSVILFQHINNKTWFYVVNGKFKDNQGVEVQLVEDSARNFKVGLLNPDLKEIVPMQYDLVHNINGTIKGMIEVDKDHKHGLYTIDGKLAVPVEYDQIFPVKDGTHLAALRKDDDYFWLNTDFSISEKTDIKVADLLTQIKDNLNLNINPPQTDIMEWNSHDYHGSVYVSPSYLVDLNIMPILQTFQNPLRKNTDGDEMETQTTAYNVDLDHKVDNPDKPNIFATLLYAIEDHYIGGRGDLYAKKSLIVVDKQHNRFLSHDIDVSGEEGMMPTTCKEYNFKPINDSLFEVKLSACVYLSIPTDTANDLSLEEMPAYHYYKITNNKLVELNTLRSFAFTKFVKMNESYLKGCYSYYITQKNAKDGKTIQADNLKTDFYQYAVNEIYAEYNYKFKNDLWNKGFENNMNRYNKTLHDNVDDSLTVIDKYNINWLKQRFKKPVIKGSPLAMR